MHRPTPFPPTTICSPTHSLIYSHILSFTPLLFHVYTSVLHLSHDGQVVIDTDALVKAALSPNLDSDSVRWREYSVCTVCNAACDAACVA